jgi:hypothetical protein
MTIVDYTPPIGSGQVESGTEMIWGATLIAGPAMVFDMGMFRIPVTLGIHVDYAIAFFSVIDPTPWVFGILEPGWSPTLYGSSMKNGTPTAGRRRPATSGLLNST